MAVSMGCYCIAGMRFLHGSLPDWSCPSFPSLVWCVCRVWWLRLAAGALGVVLRAELFDDRAVGVGEAALGTGDLGLGYGLGLKAIVVDVWQGKVGVIGFVGVWKRAEVGVSVIVNGCGWWLVFGLALVSDWCSLLLAALAFFPAP